MKARRKDVKVGRESPPHQRKLHATIDAITTKPRDGAEPFYAAVTNESFLKCSRALHTMMRFNHGEPLSFPSQGLPVLP